MIINRKISKILLKNCVWIRISLDAATSAMFRFSHGVDGKAFNKVVDNIRLLVNEKKKLNSKCTIGIGYLTSYATQEEIYKFALLGRQLKVDYAQFRPLLPRFGKDKIDYTEDSQKEIIAEIEKSLKLSFNGYSILYSKHKYDCINNGGIIRDYKKCYGHHFTAVVTADKKMYLCCHFRGVKKYCIGDLAKKSLKEIWFGEFFDEIRRNMIKKNFSEFCSVCNAGQIAENIRIREELSKLFLS